MEIQDFLLRYSGVQTYARAKSVYDSEMKKWKKFFKKISVDYFGDFFVEYSVLCSALECELAKIDPIVRRKLYYIFNYEGQTIVSEHEFMRIMKFWSCFTSNDINNDNKLDISELLMLFWVADGAKPARSLI